MKFEKKIELAIRELEAKGIWKSNYYPPIIKLLHRCGIKLPLPHYNSFVKNSMMMGPFFGLIWGMFMYFVVWEKQGFPIGAVLISVLTAAVLFGVLMASYYKYGANKHELTSWDELEDS